MIGYVVGLDLGSAIINATLAEENNNGEFQILHSVSKESKGIIKGNIVDIDKASIVIKECINELIKQSNVHIKGIYVGVGSYNGRIVSKKNIYYTDTDNEIITRKNIEKLIDMSKNVSLTDKEIVVQCIVNNFYNKEMGIVYNPTNKKCTSLELNSDIFISQKELLNNIKKAVITAGFEVSGFTLRINSLKKIFLGEKTATSNMLLIDVGAEKTEIAFYKNNELVALSYIPLGGENITNDLAICASIPKEEAETIKKTYSSCFIRKLEDENSFKAGNYEIDNKLFYNVIIARIDEIINFIYEDLLNSGFYEEIDSLILLGNGLNYFEGIKRIFEEKFKKKVINITKYDLDIKDSSAITSIAIVKDAYDNVKLVYDENNIPGKEITNTDERKKDSISSKNTYLKKIRGFFDF
ncbi:cell division protein FtsA [Clostridium cavendishii DSM 21758]|uniref:Cell division protein FtsA n=1 Tax=Clostridium cavendishii DSM 21758 TaxID=1121302 RepID=A0A1M6KDL1_9CLOT|nr:cell division FtsA domain-containing protein [Clostridium cavendishii]SHJ57021.1 cell division protein FtsA [Clostridium cavendishii DSM 21758]